MSRGLCLYGKIARGGRRQMTSGEKRTTGRGSKRRRGKEGKKRKGRREKEEGRRKSARRRGRRGVGCRAGATGRSGDGRGVRTAAHGVSGACIGRGEVGMVGKRPAAGEKRGRLSCGGDGEKWGWSRRADGCPWCIGRLHRTGRRGDGRQAPGGGEKGGSAVMRAAVVTGRPRPRGERGERMSAHPSCSFRSPERHPLADAVRLFRPAARLWRGKTGICG